MTKLTGYCLDESHEPGAEKARVFRASLGLTASDAEALRDALLAAADAAEAVPGEVDQYGERFRVDFLMRHEGKEATVRSAWIYETGDDIPRLVTCFVL
jgi:hypothetical protein